MHLRPPSIARGVSAFLWAMGFGLFIWLGLVGIGISHALSVIVAFLSFGAIFLFVRIFGDEELRQPRSRGESR